MGDHRLLEVTDLSVEFMTGAGWFAAVEDVSFTVESGEILGVVGESGAGKSVMGKAVMGLIPDNGRVTGGEIRFRGEDVLAMDEAELRAFRGSGAAMIFQDPSESLNPTLTVGRQIERVVRWNADEPMADDAVRDRAAELLAETGIPSPDDRLDDYPHEFSGGMQQRALIAMALAADPDLLIADEPSTALDVTIEAQILRLLKRLKREYELGVIFVTHDLAVENYIADRLAVMYAGEIVEEGPVEDVFAAPCHPYTEALLGALPTLAGDAVTAIPGSMPDLGERPAGCSYCDRCRYATDVCATDSQPLESAGSPDRRVACHHSDEVEREGVR